MLDWSDEKNELLKSIRGVSFEEVAIELEAGRFIGPEDNPSRPGQKRVIVKIRDYPHVVPIAIDDRGNWFLKTIIPSRKAKKAGTI
jgi:uncharacterized DUF497 family protein